MAQELKYVVRFDPHDGDLSNIKKTLDDVQSARPRKSRKDAPKEIRDEQLALDELTKAYLKNSQELAKLQKQIGGYKESLNTLKRVQKESGELTEEQAQQEAALSTALKDTRGDYNKQTKELISQQQAIEASGDSYDEMRLRMKALSVEIRNTQSPLGDNKETVALLTNEYNTLNAKLKEVDSAMGNHQREVGNYDNAIRSAANAIAIWQGPLGPLAGRVNAFATTIRRLTEAKNANAGAAIRWARTIRTALVLSGIGLLIVALTSVIKFFRRTERGQQQLRIAMAGLSAVFETLADRSSALGERLVEFAKAPRQGFINLGNAAKELSDVLIDALVHRVKNIGSFYGGLFRLMLDEVKFFGLSVKMALADVPLIGRAIDVDAVSKDLDALFIKIMQGASDVDTAWKGMLDSDFITDGISRIAESFKTLASDIRSNVRQSMDLERAMNAVLVEERNLIVARSEQNKQLQRSRELARDLDADFKLRIDALRAVAEAEEDLLQRELTNERQRLRIMAERDRMHDSTEQDLRELAEQRAKVNNLEAESAKRQISLLRDVTAVERQEREFRQRVRRNEFDLHMGNLDLLHNAELRKLLNAHRELEAAELERSRIGIDSKEREYEIYQELLDQRFSDEEAKRIAAQRVELEDAQKLADAEQRIFEIRRANREQLLDATTQLAKNSLSAMFGDNKQAAIAGAIVDTYGAANKALNSAAPPLNFINMAAVIAAGIANVRKIMSTQLGSSSVSVQTPDIPNQSESFGLVDTSGSLGSELLSSQAPGQMMQPNIILEGEFDPEFLSVKVKQGSDALSGRNVSIGL